MHFYAKKAAPEGLRVLYMVIAECFLRDTLLSLSKKSFVPVMYTKTWTSLRLFIMLPWERRGLAGLKNLAGSNMQILPSVGLTRSHIINLQISYGFCWRPSDSCHELLKRSCIVSPATTTGVFERCLFSGTRLTAESVLLPDIVSETEQCLKAP